MLVGAYFVDVNIGVMFSSSYGRAAMAERGWMQEWERCLAVAFS